jgi:hypothetical protein
VGSPNNFSGSGPWTWTCSGINGGSTASCSAHYGHTNCNIPGYADANGGSGNFSHDGTITLMCKACCGSYNSCNPYTGGISGWRLAGSNSGITECPNRTNSTWWY